MTIHLSLRQTDDLAALSNAVFLALRDDEPDLAREAAACGGRDADEYIKAVLALRADLQVEWREAK